MENGSLLFIHPYEMELNCHLLAAFDVFVLSNRSLYFTVSNFTRRRYFLYIRSNSQENIKYEMGAKCEKMSLAHGGE